MSILRLSSAVTRQCFRSVARLRDLRASETALALTTLLRHRSTVAPDPISASYVPPDSHRRIGELQQQMRALYSAGRYGEARESGTECLALARAAFGHAHPVSASVANNVALMHKSLGETDQATELYREALGCYRRTLGEHASTATALCNLALLLRQRADSGGEMARGWSNTHRADGSSSESSSGTPSRGEMAGVSSTHRAEGSSPTMPSSPPTPENPQGPENLLGDRDELRREAKVLLTEALAMRRKLLGDTHPQ